MPTRRPFTAAALVTLLAGSACASAPAGSGSPTPAANAVTPDTGTAGAKRPAGVLAAFVGQALVIVPAQRLRVAAGAPAWAPTGDAVRAYLGGVDEEIATALTDRGVAKGWVLPAQVARSARRNPTMSSDPYGLAVEALLPTSKPTKDGEVLDPLRSQLRAITALTEARYVLVPAELRFERESAATAAEGGHAVLHLAIVDTRMARVVWTGDVASDAATSLSPVLAASLADRVANLAAPAP